MALIGIQVDIFSIILLIIIYYMNISKTDNRGNRLFNNVIFATMVILVLDCSMFLLDGKSIILITTVTVLYYIFTPIVGLCSIIYLEYKMEHTHKRTRNIRKTAYPLLIVYSIICIISIKTKWIFRIDSNGFYHRGDFFWISETICLLLIVFPIIRAIKIMMKAKDNLSRKTSLEIIAVVIPPVIGAVIQLLCYGVSTNWLGVVLSIFIIFISFQNSTISTDHLTGINNRRVLYRYLENKTILNNKNQRLFLYVIDVDGFKLINDTYGHAEGDNALIYIAEILKAACRINDDFLARMGGDEFAIVCIRNPDEDTTELTSLINKQIERFNAIKCANYKISLSMGCAEFGEPDTGNVDALMKKADKLMYSVKRENKLEDSLI